MSFSAFGTAGDAGLRAEAGDPGELMAELALGFAALSSPEKANPVSRRSITLEAGGLPELAVKFLNELVFLADTAGFLPAQARAELDGAEGAYVLRAELDGEDDAFSSRPRGLLVKAATYHKLKVERDGGLWRAEVVLDI